MQHTLPKVFVGFFLLVLPVLLFVFKYNPVAAAKCLIESGSYETRVAALGTPVSRYCVFEYSDAGKKCTSSDECEGHCLVTPDTQFRSTGSTTSEYVGGYGKCEATNRWTGCFDGTIESPLAFCE